MPKSILGKTPCPYCYYPINAGALWFRCKGRPAPGKAPCAKQVDDQRLSVVFDSTPVYPSFPGPGGLSKIGGATRATCPTCHGDTGTKVCPACHSVLPASFGAKSPMFGVVGVKGSGKTVMLTALTTELLGPIARRFDATITDVDSSALLARLGVSGADMAAGGRLPLATQQYTQAQSVPAVIEWRYARRRVGIEREQATILSFYDTSGEDVETDDLARGLHYLSAADGLIVILDPFGFPENRATAVARGVDEDQLRRDPVKIMASVTTAIREADHLKGTKRIKRPLAVVVDDHRNLIVGIELAELRYVLLALPDIDIDRTIGKLQLLQRDENLLHVRAGQGIEIDHGISLHSVLNRTMAGRCRRRRVMQSEGFAKAVQRSRLTSQYVKPPAAAATAKANQVPPSVFWNGRSLVFMPKKPTISLIPPKRGCRSPQPPTWSPPGGPVWRSCSSEAESFLLS